MMCCGETGQHCTERDRSHDAKSCQSSLTARPGILGTRWLVCYMHKLQPGVQSAYALSLGLPMHVTIALVNVALFLTPFVLRRASGNYRAVLKS
jgi:hypothetical protein